MNIKAKGKMVILLKLKKQKCSFQMVRAKILNVVKLTADL